MIRWYSGVTAALLVSLAQAAQASTGASDDEPTVPPEQQVDVSRLGLNLERIQRQLRQTTIREERDGLNLRYIVDVFGQAPKIELFTKEDNLLNGQVPRSAPTHQDMWNLVTPQEYRAPAANLGNLFKWVAGKANDKK